MKKSDLKDGMIVETGEDLYLVCGDKFLSLNGYMEFKDYDENLKIKDEGFEKYNINFVYKEEGSLGLGLKNLLNSTKLLKKIWERPREIDWSKVPFGTKVIASDDLNEDDELEKIFVGYEPKLEEYPFIVAFDNCDDAQSFRYCKIHPSVKIKEEWYK
ncbi:hypothetical protein [Clostridium perfringens]|uniref:hypothetical protein n=1 Tax=Clostridium perfringens TaxID=1502 RepID=UPI0012415E0F|nr:hypothetical protein [Clostridium perfringens]